MTGAFDNFSTDLNRMETSVKDGATRALQDSVDFARKHEAALITAGIVVIGTVALVKSGAAGDLLDMLKPAATSVEGAAGEALSADTAGAALTKAAPEDIARLGENSVRQLANSKHH
jgi:hypothetical protein